MDQNNVTEIGRLSRPPKYFPSGIRGEEHCTFTIAVNRVVPPASGPVADYIPCSFWGEEARFFCENRTTGDEVGIRGRIRTGFVEQSGGSGSTFFWEVRVDKVSFGKRSRKNMEATPVEDKVTRAVAALSERFGG